MPITLNISRQNKIGLLSLSFFIFVVGVLCLDSVPESTRVASGKIVEVQPKGRARAEIRIDSEPTAFISPRGYSLSYLKQKSGELLSRDARITVDDQSTGSKTLMLALAVDDLDIVSYDKVKSYLIRQQRIAAIMIVVAFLSGGLLWFSKVK